MLHLELSQRFPVQQLMNSMGIYYPQYWLQPNAESSFDRYLEIIKAFYCGNNRIIVVGRASKNRTGPILDASLLNFQANMFKMTMMRNCHAAMVCPLEVIPLTAIWRTINRNAMLTHNISEYLKVAEIACVQVLGSVEDERTFSTLSFIKNRLRNRLIVNLELVWPCMHNTSSQCQISLMEQRLLSGKDLSVAMVITRSYWDHYPAGT
jgi:hypothetical protein